MLYFWFFDGLLAIISFYCCVMLLRQNDFSTTAIALGFAMLGLAASAGSLRYGLNLQLSLKNTHQLLSQLYAISGHLMVAGGLFSLTYRFLNQRFFYYLLLCVSSCTFVIIHWFITIDSIIFGIIMTISSLILAIRFFVKNQNTIAITLLLATVLYLFNGLFIGTGAKFLLGFDIRVAVFHLLLSCWCVVLTWSLIKFKNIKLSSL